MKHRNFLRAAALAVALALAGSRNARGASPAPPDEESRRVELLSRLERSVVLVLVKGKEIVHDEARVGLEATISLGTGVVLAADGLILTAAHVVAGADEIRVKSEKAEPVAARIVFLDDLADIALVRLASVPVPLVPARLGDSDQVKKGESVYVIGNPQGIEQSVSMGIVSGRHPVRHVFGTNVKAELIQTDAAINTGNSGGPIFNGHGEVVAIAQAILTKGGGSEGLGFGLAINVVKAVLALDPCVWLGFSGAPLDETWSKVLNVPDANGFLVTRVTPGSPADLAGLKGGAIPIQIGAERLLVGGDVILRVNGLPVLEWARSETSGTLRPGDQREQKLTVLRAGRTMEIPVVTVHRTGW